MATTKTKEKRKTNKKSAKEIVEENRKKIVDKLISNMEKGYIFSEWAWNRNAFLPRNAVTGTQYQGINRLNLSFEAIENGYEDPRWLTLKKLMKWDIGLNQVQKEYFVKNGYGRKWRK